jgi:hypothetical protein
VRERKHNKENKRPILPIALQQDPDSMFHIIIIAQAHGLETMENIRFSFDFLPIRPKGKKLV